MSILTRARNFLADLFTVMPEPDWDIEATDHCTSPSLVAVMMQLGTLVSLHREKPGYSDIDIIIHDGDAVRSIVAHINDTWAHTLNAPDEVIQALSRTGIVEVETDAETQMAKIGGIRIHWPAPGVDMASIIG